MSEFNIQEIEKTFTSYKKGALHDGVVVARREDGLIFNIGGKKDAFIPKNEIDNFESIKIGDRFSVVISGQNEEGLILASKNEADVTILGIQNAMKLKLGSIFTFVPTAFDNGLISKMGDYSIFVPADEISMQFVDRKALIGKQQEAVVTELDRDQKKIIASIKLLQEQVHAANEELFWKSIFINKIVEGTVKKILPYGAFIEVGGIDCFIHISDLSYTRIESPAEVLKEGQTLNFKVIELDRNNKKVKLGLKQILPDPKTQIFNSLAVGQMHSGKVVKILPFGAIIELDVGISGLLHISAVTDRRDSNIYEFVKLGDTVLTTILALDPETQKISLSM